MANKELGIADPVYDALRIRSGQSIAPDLGGGTTGGSGLENKIYVWHADGSAIDTFEPTAAGLALALAAATTVDTVWLPSMTIALTAGVTVPAGVTVRGISNGAVLSFSGFGGIGVTLSSASVLSDLSIYFNGTGQTKITGVEALDIEAMIDRVNVRCQYATTNVGIHARGLSLYRGVIIRRSGGEGFNGANNFGLALENYTYTQWSGGQGNGGSASNVGIQLDGTLAGRNAPLIFSCWGIAFAGVGVIADGVYITPGSTGRATNCNGDGTSYGLSVGAGATLESGHNSWDGIFDAGGTIIDLGGEGALDWFVVTDYGATGDGTTDDAAAFQACFDACGTASGGTIYIPYTADHYRLASAVTLDTQHRTTIYFEDGAVIKQDAGVTALIIHQGIESGGVYVARGREVTILNPQIDGNSGAGTVGIEVRDSDRVAIHHPNIWKNAIGVWFHAVEGSGYGQCEGCEISGTGTIAGTGADSDIKFTMEAGSNGSFMETYIRDVEFTSGANGGIYVGPGCLLYRCFIMGTCWPALSQIVFHVAGTLIGSWLHIAIDYLNQAATTITILKVASTAVGTENDWWKFDIIGATGGTVGIWDIASGKHLRLQQNGPDNYLDATSFVTVSKIAQTYPQIELGIDGTAGGRINFGSGTGATDGTLERRGAGWLGTSVPFGLKTYTTAGRPSAASREGALIYDSDLNIVLQSDGSNWIPVSGALALNDLTDVDITGSGTGDIIYNNAGTWEDYPLGIGSRVTVSGTKIRFGNVAGGNYLEIDSVTGTLRLVGDATTYDDFRVEASVVKPGATAPNWKAFGPSGNLQALMFEASHDDEAYFELQMPHNWKLGTNIYPHVHWTPTDATAGNVVWQLEYAWANIGDAYGAPSTMATDPTAAGGVAWVHKLTDFKSGGNNYIDGTGKTLSSMLVCRVHRNSNAGSDTLNKDVALLEIDFHYQIDSLGSDEPLVKDASASLLLETGDILLLETGDRLLTE